MITVKKLDEIITLRATSYCVCGCKRLVLRREEDHDGPVCVARCYKCDIELEHASDFDSLKRKLEL